MLESSIEDIGLVLKEHEPVRILYNPIATCSSRILKLHL